MSNVKLLPKAANGCRSGCKNGCKNSPMNKARFFPIRQRRRRKLTLHSEFGDVRLVVDYGQDPQSRQWGCPLQRAWGLGPHQKLMPGLAEKLCFTVTATGSYEEAATVASKWGVPVDDSTLHALVQRLGMQAQTQQRLATLPPEREPQRGRHAVGRVAGGRLAGAPARGGLGQKENVQTPRGMARIEDRGVLPTRASGADPRRAGPAGRQGHRQLAGPPRRTGTAPEWGSRAGWFGPRAPDVVLGRWRGLDLEFTARPLGERHGVAGFLSRERAPLGLGRGLLWFPTAGAGPVG